MGGGCFQIIIYFACSTYSFVDNIVFIIIITFLCVNKMVSGANLHRLKPNKSHVYRFSPQSAVSSHCSLPV